MSSRSDRREVDLFRLNGFASYYKFTRVKKIDLYAVSGVASNIPHSPIGQLS